MPKAGGSTAEHFLRRYLNISSRTEELVCARYTKVSAFLHQPPARRATAKLISSKASVDAWDEDGRTFLTATVLRDPVERIVSHFRYLQAGVGEPFVDSCTVHNFSWPDKRHQTSNSALRNKMFGAWYRQYHRRLPDISNFEVRLLVTRRESAFMVNASSVVLYLEPKACRSISPLPAVTETEFNFAMSRLRQMSLVGLMERMEETLGLWRHALGFETSMVHICGNEDQRHCGASEGVAAELEKQDPEVLALIRSDNIYSILLYEEAVAIFEAQRLAVPVISRTQSATSMPHPNTTQAPNRAAHVATRAHTGKLGTTPPKHDKARPHPHLPPKAAPHTTRPTALPLHI
jgi:hypothetical protein